MIGSEVLGKLRDRLEGDVHLREVIRGSATFLILRIFGMVVAYAFTLLVTRKLGASAWGIFALSFTVLQIASVLSRLGLDGALLRFIAQYKAQGKGKTAFSIYLKSLKVVIPISLFLTALLYYLSPIIADKVFNKDYLSEYLQIMSLGILPFTLLFINSESLRSLKKIKEYTFFQSIFPYFLAFAFVFMLLMFSFKLTEKEVVLSFVFAIFIACVFSFLFLIRELKNLSGNSEDIPLKSILSVSLPMFMSSSLFMIMSWTDIIMLGIFRTQEEVGIYNVAVRLSVITSFTLAAINSIAAPKFAELWGKKDLEGLKKVAQQSTKLIFWTSAPVLILYLLFPSFFMGLFGEEFKDGALALVILTVGQFVNAASGSVALILGMTGKQRFAMNIIFVIVIINFIGNMLIIPKLGLIGAAAINMTTTIIWNAIFTIYIKMKYKFLTFALLFK
ncbi:MAG TPA: flippase [Persephonella sp.]|nr:flippase [Persephonella sp.]